MAKPFESWIQDLVYNVDVGIGLRIVQFLLAVLAIFGLSVIYQASEFKSLTNAEGMDCAQLGRNYALTGKLVTQYIRPASLWLLEKNKPKAQPDAYLQWHPDTMHPPLYPIVLGKLMKIAGQTHTAAKNPAGDFSPEKFVILPANHIFSILSGILVFILGTLLFEQRVGLLAMISFFLSNAIWVQNLTGTAVSMTVFLCMVALLAALSQYRAQDKGVGMVGMLIRSFITGAFCAMAFLTRYGAVAILPGILLFLCLRDFRKGWRSAAAVLGFFLILITPWLLRNIHLTGTPLGLAPYTALAETSLFPEDSFIRNLHPENSLKLGAALKAIQAKFLETFPEILDQAPRLLGHGLFSAFFLCSFFFRFVRDDTHRFRWGAAVSLAFLLVLAGYFGESTLALTQIFLPITLIFGSAFFFLLLDRLDFKLRILNWGVVGLMALLSALPLFFTLMPPRPGLPYPPYFPPYINHVSQMLLPDELICADMPWATAWYGGRQSLELPVTLDQFYEVNDYRRRVNALYFTTHTRNLPYIRTLATGMYESWFPVFEGRLPADFPLREGFPMHNLDQLFLTDRPRWE